MHFPADIIFSIILTSILLTILLSSSIVVLSYLFYWYELANSRPKLIKIRFRSARVGRALLLLSSESLSFFISWILYPIGWIPVSTLCFHKRPHQTIILLHGLYQNRACLYWLQFRLALHGHRVISLTMPPWKDLESLTEQLDQIISQLRQTKKIQRVTLIGHSFGGIIARNYIQRRGGASHVEQCFTLGTPHFGSKLTSLSITALALVLTPRNALLNQLNRAPWPEKIPFTSLYSNTDNLVLPAKSGQHPNAENISVTPCGHMSLLYHPTVFNVILKRLR